MNTPVNIEVINKMINDYLQIQNMSIFNDKSIEIKLMLIAKNNVVQSNLRNNMIVIENFSNHQLEKYIKNATWIGSKL